MIRWIAIGTLLQTGMVLAGHWLAAIAFLFGPLGAGISFAAGLLWARDETGSAARAAGGGMNDGPGGRGPLRCGPWFVAFVFLWLPGVPFGPSALMAQEVAPSPAGPAVSVEDFAWLAGEWEGPGPDGAAAQIDYMPPSAGVLPAVFRLLDDDRVVVLEMVTLVEEPEGMVMYVRHFDPSLVPLEEERAIRLRLVERDGETYHFRNTNEGQNPVRSTLTRTETGFVSRSILARSDGSTAEIRVEYHRRD